MSPDAKKLVFAIAISPWAASLGWLMYMVAIYAMHKWDWVGWMMLFAGGVCAVGIAYVVTIFCGVPLYLLAKKLNKVGYWSANIAALLLCTAFTVIEIWRSSSLQQIHDSVEFLFELEKTIPLFLFLSIPGICVATAFVWCINDKPRSEQKRL